MDYVKKISIAMSLRQPQSEALEYLDSIASKLDFKNESKEKCVSVASENCENKLNLSVAKEFSFPSYCYKMATGIGKTRLMGASIYYLYKTKGYKHFFILVPGSTIYDKIRKEAQPHHPKYMFKGLEAEMGRPKVYDGENYLNYPVKFAQGELKVEKTSEIQLFIFNISKIFNRGDVTFKFHEFQETLGNSFANVLASIDDLVICMDEAHRYYAPASMKAIDCLKPILGLEFTATAKPENRNIIYSYGLAKGAGKYLKIPVVMGRTNMAGYSEQDVQEMKLMDGIKLHENRKGVLKKYCFENNLTYVKPIVLISCKDTTHAQEVRKIIDSDTFFDGKYKGKVIEVHSGTGSVETDETIAKLLTIESNSNIVEIVLHVYKLKEGWDVNNLFTIIPLNAAKSEILALQTIGRGLRLPFGVITNNDEIDTLDIVAHEHYRALIDDVKSNPIFRARNLDDNPIEETKTITIDAGMDEAQLSLFDSVLMESNVKTYQDVNDVDMQAKMYESYIKKFKPTVTKLKKEDDQPTFFDLIDNINGGEIKKEEKPNAAKPQKPMTKEEFTQKIVKFAECISVPRILITPSTTCEIVQIDVKKTRQDFAIESSKIEGFDVVNNQLLYSIDATVLEDGDPVNTIACALMDNVPEFSYEDGDYVLKLSNDYVSQLDGDMSNKKKVVRRYLSLILNDILSQIRSSMKSSTRIIYKVQKEFIVFGKFIKVIKYDGEVKFSAYITDKRNIRKYLFTGYKKSFYEKCGFDSSPEKVFAQCLEEDKDVVRWIKPPLNSMGIYYKAGSQYCPDFLVETATEKFMVEVKANDDVENPDVLLKKQEGEAWCKYASVVDNDKKQWHYRLIAEKNIVSGNSLKYMVGVAEDIVG